MKSTAIIFICAIFVIAIFLYSSNDVERPITFMATTTTEDSGLLSAIIPELEKDTGLNIQLVTFGTGKVLRSAMDGNADVILVHDPINEIAFMNAGYGKERLTIMRNDFVLVGPTDDPANIKNSKDLKSAFRSIIEANVPFVSRGDESGTHQAEKRIWTAVKLNPNETLQVKYFVTGTGMGRSLNIAVEKSAYILTDRATWLTFQNKGKLEILKENDALLSNVYSLISVNPERHPHISEINQSKVMKWFKSEHARNTIQGFESSGKPLFLPLL